MTDIERASARDKKNDQLFAHCWIIGIRSVTGRWHARYIETRSYDASPIGEVCK
ncbi:hypothetical protein BGW80DRAFT_909385 [Lactifluus volemus]|nr:hypothetical protein BGW80DRAFT_909385 [Lactifluus volemus]